MYKKIGAEFILMPLVPLIITIIKEPFDVENAESDTEEEETLYFHAYFPDEYDLTRSGWNRQDEDGNSEYDPDNDPSYMEFWRRVNDSAEDLGTVVDIIYGGHHEYDEVNKSNIWIILYKDIIAEICVTEEDMQSYQRTPLRHQHIHPVPHSRI